MFITVHFKQFRPSTEDEAWAARRVRVDAISDFYGEKSAILCFNEGTLAIRETPAEVMALVAAKEREQARERIAAMALQGALANPERVGNGFCAPIDEAIKYADGLLDALAAREGA